MDGAPRTRRQRDRLPPTDRLDSAPSRRRRSRQRCRSPRAYPFRLNGPIPPHSDQRPRLPPDRSADLHARPLQPTRPAAKLDARILAGGDFVQWSPRFGLLVFDEGRLRSAAATIAASRPWPDADRKRRHAAKSVELARRMVASGDEGAAVEQVRTAVSLTARARLLQAGVFPGSRDELPQQLAGLGLADIGEALTSTIHRDARRARDGCRPLRLTRQHPVRRGVDRLERERWRRALRAPTARARGVRRPDSLRRLRSCRRLAGAATRSAAGDPARRRRATAPRGAMVRRHWP